jgi:hypothetical protein
MNQPYHGPHVVLSLEEARTIKDYFVGAPVKTEQIKPILAKIDRALSSDPKFLLPHP